MFEDTAMNSQPKDHYKAPFTNGRTIEQADEMNLEVRNAQKLAEVVNWLKCMFPLLKIPADVSEEELSVILNDGAVLCNIMNRSSPGLILEVQTSTAEQRLENVKKFLVAVEEMGLPRFRPSDLDQGSMMAVIDCLLALKDHLDSDRSGGLLRKKLKPEAENFESAGSAQGDQLTCRQFSRMWGEERRRSFSEKFQRVPRNPKAPDIAPTTSHHVGHKFHEVFQLKQGRYSDLPAAKISEMLKSTSLDNAPTQSLLSVVNGILDESVERKNGEIPERVACLLRRVVQEIERRISTQAEHIRNQNNLIKAREEKYQSRIRVLETLATGTSEEAQIVMNQLQQIKVEKTKIEERKKFEEQDVVRLAKEKENSDLVIAALKEEMEMTRRKKENSDLLVAALKEEMETTRKKTENSDILITALKEEMETTRKKTENSDILIAALKEEMEITKRTSEVHCAQLEQEIKNAKMELEEAKKFKTESEESKRARRQLGDLKKEKMELEKRLKMAECLLEESRNRAKELEEASVSTLQSWRKKEHSYQNFIGVQINALQEIRVASGSIRREIITSEMSWMEEINTMGAKLKQLGEAAKNYHSVLAENRRLYNEIQDLKGNIRVYCRIRPFLPGETRKQTTIEYIGENGELSIANPSKQGKDGHRGFKFDKVFDPTASQEKVFLDTQPLVRSVLDGYNVCIFAYGQTGSGKTYTMAGPEASSEEEWGVNYRALNDLFQISCNRKSSFGYEVGVQMVEIYNEQVRDLLTSDNSSRKLGILSTSQSNGLAVPDASMHPVESTNDVIELMEFGHTNRSVSATALNQRSSRSHSVVTVHVRGSDLETGAILRGSLHLVDLAGSERVDRSEVTGDRLKEAQHINKSLSALGDVIFALAQKNAHVPYRNSKLTQLLQSSLGGQAKTLMFVQINPNVDSYSESLSTLKFAERVSGVELGAARSNKEGKDVRELMDQVASLKDMIARKDEEIERLQLLKGTQSPSNGPNSLRSGPSSPVKPSLRRSSSQSQRMSSLRTTRSSDKLVSDPESECSDRQSDTGSQQSLDEMRQHKFSGEVDTGQNIADIEILGLNRVDSVEKLSDVSDGGVSMGTDTDGSTGNAIEFPISPECGKPAEGTERSSSEQKARLPSLVPRPPQKSTQSASTRPTSKVTSKLLTGSRKSTFTTATSTSSKIGSTSSLGKVDSTGPGRGTSIKMTSAATATSSSSKMPSTSSTTSPSSRAVLKRWQ